MVSEAVSDCVTSVVATDVNPDKTSAMMRGGGEEGRWAVEKESKSRVSCCTLRIVERAGGKGVKRTSERIRRSADNEHREERGEKRPASQRSTRVEDG